MEARRGSQLLGSKGVLHVLGPNLDVAFCPPSAGILDLDRRLPSSGVGAAVRMATASLEDPRVVRSSSWQVGVSPDARAIAKGQGSRSGKLPGVWALAPREYLELEAGERYPNFKVWDRICIALRRS